MAFDKFALRNICVGALTTLGYLCCTILLIMGLNFFFTLPTVLALLITVIVTFSVVCMVTIPKTENTELMNQFMDKCDRLKLLIQILAVVITVLIVTIVVLINRLNAIS